MIFNSAVTHSVLQLTFLRHRILGVESGRRKGTGSGCPSPAAALTLVVLPALSRVFSTEPGRSDCSAGSCQQCLLCSPQPSLGMSFLSNGHEIFWLSPLAPGQTGVSISGVAQRMKNHCRRTTRRDTTWCKQIYNCDLFILTTKKWYNNVWSTLTSRTYY